MKPQHRRFAFAICALALGLAGCSGGSSGSSAPPVAGGPSPASSPTPTPSSSPAPSPTPTGTIAGVAPGETFAMEMECAATPDGVVTDGRLTGVTTLGVSTTNLRDIYGALYYLKIDSFAFDVNGFGGSTYGPADKRTPANPIYDLFVKADAGASYELQLAKAVGPLKYATLGFSREQYDYGNGLTNPACFFAAGRTSSALPTTGTPLFAGVADGLSQLSGSTKRIYGSEALVDLDLDAHTGIVTIHLVGRDNPFGDFTAAKADPEILITGKVSISGSSVTGTLSGPTGITGKIRGKFFGSGFQGVGLSFFLSDPAGKVAFGAIAADIKPTPF